MAGSSEIDALLSAARAKPAPVYLLIGEPFQTEAAAHQLIDLLVPPQRRSFNLERYDGRSAAIGPILDSLREKYGDSAGGSPGIETWIEPADTQLPDTTLLTLAKGKPGRRQTTLDAGAQAAAEKAVKSVGSRLR